MKPDIKKLTIIIGSKNPVKISAAEQVFLTLFPDHNIHCIAIDAPSGVSEQPIGEDETLNGAQNRVAYAKQHHHADFYVAMEGGAAHFNYGVATFAFIVVADKTHESIGRSCNLPLPESLYQAIITGEELGDVMDKTFNTTNIKQQGGAIGLLTNNHATRQSTYIQALTLAMAPFLHPKLYAKEV